MIISEDQVLNDMTYRKMKKQLETQFLGKYAVIAGGKLIGAEDSLENAWALAFPFKTALVTRMTKKPFRSKILGSSLLWT